MIAPFDIVIGAVYVLAAAIIFDRVLAVLRRDLFLRFVKFWALAVAAGLFGIGRLTGTETFYDIAHPCLIFYVALRVHEVTTGQVCRWGKGD